MLGISPQDRHHVSPPFEMDNRGKRSVVLDLTTADGQARVRELLSDADVVQALALFNDGADESLDGILDDIARIIVNITTTVDPGRIVLGGPLSAAQPLVDGLRDRIERGALTDITVGTSPLGRNAPLAGAVIGALELARELRRAK